MTTKKIMLGAGCFWGVEALFSKLDGVLSTSVGYSGGENSNPTYKEVCTGQTGHAEVILIEFNQDLVSLEQILDVFWSNHNPTTLNQQGPDIGTQYRSAIFYYDENQREIAEESMSAFDKSEAFRNPVVTQIAPATDFHKAEEYHQKYLEKKGLTSCKI